MDFPRGLKPRIIFSVGCLGDESPAYQPIFGFRFKLKPSLFRVIYDPIPTRVEKRATGW